MLAVPSDNFNFALQFNPIKQGIMTKKWTDTLLAVSFLAVFLCGIVLHLKRYGILIEPRAVIKVVHYSIALVMVCAFVVHYRGGRVALQGMARKHPRFVAASKVLLWAVVLTAATGAVKLLSPVRIPNLGLVHTWCGIAMAALAFLHLAVGLPLLWAKWRR